MRLQQEFKTKDLVVSGGPDLTKDDIEILLEAIVSAKFGGDVGVCAEEFPGSAGLWRVTTDPDGNKHCILYTWL